MSASASTGLTSRNLSFALERSPARVQAGRERRFAAALLAPAFMALIATTTFPLLYLAWTSAYALGYSAAVLALAMFIFRRRDFV